MASAHCRDVSRPASGTTIVVVAAQSGRGIRSKAADIDPL
jgi:hypothetical protein